MYLSFSYGHDTVLVITVQHFLQADIDGLVKAGVLLQDYGGRLPTTFLLSLRRAQQALQPKLVASRSGADMVSDSASNSGPAPASRVPGDAHQAPVTTSKVLPDGGSTAGDVCPGPDPQLATVSSSATAAASSGSQLLPAQQGHLLDSSAAKVVVDSTDDSSLVPGKSSGGRGTTAVDMSLSGPSALSCSSSSAPGEPETSSSGHDTTDSPAKVSSQGPLAAPENEPSVEASPAPTPTAVEGSTSISGSALSQRSAAVALTGTKQQPKTQATSPPLHAPGELKASNGNVEPSPTIMSALAAGSTLQAGALPDCTPVSTAMPQASGSNVESSDSSESASPAGHHSEPRQLATNTSLPANKSVTATTTAPAGNTAKLSLGEQWQDAPLIGTHHPTRPPWARCQDVQGTYANIWARRQALLGSSTTGKTAMAPSEHKTPPAQAGWNPQSKNALNELEPPAEKVQGPHPPAGAPLLYAAGPAGREAHQEVTGPADHGDVNKAEVAPQGKPGFLAKALLCSVAWPVLVPMVVVGAGIGYFGRGRTRCPPRTDAA